MANPAVRPISIWLGDTAPAKIWEFPFDITGSDFRLLLRFGDRLIERRVSDDGLAMNTATRRITWTYAPDEFVGMTARTGRYELTRIVAGGGEIRTYVVGPVTIRSLING